MGNLEKNPWAPTPKQILAHTPHEKAEEKEYDFSGAESVFGGEDDDEINEPKRDEPAKH